MLARGVIPVKGLILGPVHLYLLSVAGSYHRFPGWHASPQEACKDASV